MAKLKKNRMDRDSTKRNIICLCHSIPQSTHTANCTNKSHCHTLQPPTHHSTLIYTPLYPSIHLYKHTSSTNFISYYHRDLFKESSFWPRTRMGEGGEVDVAVQCESNGAIVYGKRMLKRLVWRVRAEMRKMRKKQRTDFSFCYDPLSYALNFDDGNFGFFCT